MEPDALPATRLGPYRLLRRLGRGGMAEVFLAVAYGASGFEKRVALKTLLPELRGSAEHERLLIEEAKLGARLSHRGLVQVHDLGVDDGVYWVRMDYVDGGDLKARLGRGPLPTALALLVAEELAQALAYVHALGDERGQPLGLVHRDVSPANVLCSRAGCVMLADFGVAKATSLADVTRVNVRKGKYAYMSPEQAAGLPLSSASDQFSLGILLAELASGRRPFDAAEGSAGDGILATLERIRAADAPDLAGLDDDVAALVARCLVRAPAGRFADMIDLGRAIAGARARRAPVGAADLAAWLNTPAV